MPQNFNNNAISRANNTVSINPLKYKSIQCDKCGCEVFSHGYVFKKISGIELGTGTEDQIIPIDVFYCSKCGELMPEYREVASGGKDNEDSPKKLDKKETKLLI